MTTVLLLWLGLSSSPASPHSPSSPPIRPEPEEAKQQPSDEAPGPSVELDAAGRAFESGSIAFDQKNYHEAATFFRRAQALKPHPDTAFNLGLTLVELGEPLKAWNIFASLGSSIPGAPPPSPDLKKAAAEELKKLERHLAFFQLRSPRATRICLDGKDFVPAPHERHFHPLRPGRHHLQLDEESFQLELEAGERRVLDWSPAPRRTITPQESEAYPIILGLSTSTGLLAGGFALGAATSSRGAEYRRNLAITSGALAIGSASGALVALLFHQRQKQRASASSPPEVLPPCGLD